jgi:NTE family protein
MKKILYLMISSLIASTSSFLPIEAKSAETGKVKSDGGTTVKPRQRPTIGLALGGGGMRGIAHIGVLRVLERENIPIDCIAGSSIGALVGGMYAAGIPVDRIEEIFKDNHLKKIVGTDRLAISAIGKGLRRFVFRRPYSGIVSGKKLAKFMKKYMPEGKKNIEDLDIPFCVVTTNLCDGKAYRLTKGDLTQAILASMAMAPLIQPVKVNGDVYVDGGVSANVPTIAARQFNPSLVLAVPVDEHLKEVPAEEFNRVSAIANRLASIVLSRTDAYHVEKADVKISPDVSGIAILSEEEGDFERAVNAGEAAAEKALPKIRHALASVQKPAIQSAARKTVVK